MVYHVYERLFRPDNLVFGVSESWVDVDTRSCTSTSSLIMHQLGAEEMRLLREAQRESNQSSARVSLAGSHRGSPRSSPKSPPNSPVQGAPLIMEWQSYYMNTEPKEVLTNVILINRFIGKQQTLIYLNKNIHYS